MARRNALSRRLMIPWAASCSSFQPRLSTALQHPRDHRARARLQGVQGAPEAEPGVCGGQGVRQGRQAARAAGGAAAAAAAAWMAGRGGLWLAGVQQKGAGRQQGDHHGCMQARLEPTQRACLALLTCPSRPLARHPPPCPQVKVLNSMAHPNLLRFHTWSVGGLAGWRRGRWPACRRAVAEHMPGCCRCL